MNIQIIAVGKVREKFLQEGIQEYSKRLSGYCNLKITEIDDEKIPKKLSEKEIKAIKDREGDRILNKISNSSYIISLAIQGQNISSEEFSKKIDDILSDGKSSIIFIIGGSLGLSEKVLEKSDFKLSFSKMTFPHQLMRLILLEQIYRGMKISKGEVYHK
ncbi:MULTISPECIES: 23S rRNA (pseudouridine(1915)-N(3))-methyltransferase RlmH [Tissierellales]|jgi:23S rRNA (pseudouridine1915-N3)-methyltransferase|uniref:Ribosomal RNA large subunit methyltransferase H n=1 Tax=Acidilutibacter cellobiosedens TaxID=2507161 RepID=A0A410QH08_9FIRM|nr:MULTISPECIES: 23S rRNA (pseudouridine(1915)-N(3))-methyltransferase RlmH [Tissierellales]MBE6081236.1 23S rRNA (pseudouridine(1915)-N(3))-methyltransferase RlmH [Tissierellaceae bacterium]QAT63280.1 23S rRNA (pseudouridine(1915)-N(3))-methyltransferase RlmH [Acidilutibacter cellobiosedens]SCL95794.1 Ribosomal RNA large subunit methyltransferase H [Sporanaerobacter sp. PP17-6a]